MDTSEAPVGKLLWILQDPEVRTRILAQTRKKLRARGLDSQTATELAEDAYHDATVNILRRKCRYDSSLPGEPYVARCVFNAANDLADALEARRESDGIQIDPPDAQSPHTEPDLGMFLEALRLMSKARRQAVAAQKILETLPSSLPGHEALVQLVNNGHLPSFISPNTRSRSLQDFRAAIKRVEELRDSTRVL